MASTPSGQPWTAASLWRHRKTRSTSLTGSVTLQRAIRQRELGSGDWNLLEKRLPSLWRAGFFRRITRQPRRHQNLIGLRVGTEPRGQLHRRSEEILLTEMLRFDHQRLIYAQFSLSRIEPVPFGGGQRRWADSGGATPLTPLSSRRSRPCILRRTGANLFHPSRLLC